MHIYTKLEDVPKLKSPVITIGTFDGVHLGHQKVLSFLNEKAASLSGESVVFTFHPHPRMVLHPNDHQLELIQTIDERIDKLGQNKVDHLIVFPFSKAFSRLSALEFVRDILVNQLGMKALVIGYDHHFGRNREGSLENLQELAPLYQFDIFEIGPLAKSEVNISSTKIRQAVKGKDFTKVRSFLGSPFQISGRVVNGDKIGTDLGFPTANIAIEADYKLLPPNGVYAVVVSANNKQFLGMLNIGMRPTIAEAGEQRIEVHLLDFEGDLYDKVLKIDIIEYIRAEQNFKSKADLVSQIAEDEKKCRSILLSAI